MRHGDRYGIVAALQSAAWHLLCLTVAVGCGLLLLLHGYRLTPYMAVYFGCALAFSMLLGRWLVLWTRQHLERGEHDLLAWVVIPIGVGGAVFSITLFFLTWLW